MSENRGVQKDYILTIKSHRMYLTEVDMNMDGVIFLWLASYDFQYTYTYLYIQILITDSFHRRNRIHIKTLWVFKIIINRTSIDC